MALRGLEKKTAEEIKPLNLELIIKGGREGINPEGKTDGGGTLDACLNAAVSAASWV